MPTIDNLNIQIQASATNASKQIEKLSNAIGSLGTSLSTFETGKFNGLATGVNRLATAMQSMNNVRTADFTRLINNLTRIGNIPTATLNQTASSLSQLTRGLNQLGAVSGNVAQVTALAASLGRLGSASVQRAVTTIPQLEIALNNLITTLSRANVNGNIITLLNAISNLGNTSTRASTQINSLNNTLNQTSTATQRANSSTFSLASTFGYLYASLFWVRRVLNGFNNSIESTSGYLESFNYYTVALKKIAKEWDENWETYADENARAYSNKFITTLNDSLSKMSGIQVNVETGTLENTGLKNLGLNIQDITKASAQLASVTNSIGQTGNVSLATSSAFTKLASDMSSLYNMDYSDVMNNLQSGLIGQSRALYKYGIDITNATLQTLAYELGVEKSVSEMSQMEKQQLRIIAILRGSKVAWGDQANTINSLANQMRLFENNTEELSMVFGQLFVPLLTKALPIVNGLTIALKNLMTNIKGMLNIKIDVSTMGQGTAADDMGEIAEETENAENALKEYKNQLFGFDEVNKLSDTEANATLNTDMGDTIDLEQEILTATSEYEKFWEDAYNAMEDKVSQWAKYFEQFMVPIQEVFGHFKFGFNMDFKDFGKDIMGLTTKLNDWITRAIEKTPWGELGWKLGQFITGSTVESFNLLGKSGTTISKLIIGINDFITRSTEGIEWDSIFLAIVNGITDFANNLQIGDIIDSFANTIVALNNAILEIVGAIIENPEEIADMVFSLIAKTVELGIALMNANSKIFTNLIAGVVDKIIKAAVNELGEGFGIISEISDFLEDVFSNGIDNAANNLMNSRHMQVLQPIVDELSRPFNDLVEVGEKLETSTNEIVTTIEGIWMNLVDWFDNIGSPEWQDVIEDNFNEERWHGMIEPITNVFQERWNTLVTWFEGSAIPGWWETVRTNFTMERWRDTVGSITEAFTRRWNGMRRWFNTAVSEWWLEVQRFFSAENWENHLDGIEEGFVNAFNNAIAQVRQIWNEFANWINNALSFEFEGFNRSFEMFGTTYEVGIPSFNIDLGRLPTYSTGGFPEDGLFFANKDEIIGEFPGGKSTVVNNYQIQDGIEEAAYRGMARALTQHQGNGGNVTVTLQGDANELFKVVQNKANNYAMQTGQSPFLI